MKDFAPGRPNVWGRLRGEGGGPRLLLTGHTDTVHVRGWAERWAGTERADPFGGAVVDGEIWGRGSGDLKAGICATLAAARLVRDARACACRARSCSPSSATRKAASRARASAPA